MKITDGWMCWFIRYNPEDGTKRKVETLDEADGVFFVCPKCATPSEHEPGKFSGHPILIWFGGQPRVPDGLLPAPRWKVSGTGLHDL